jgi:hypothetical protein
MNEPSRIITPAPARSFPAPAPADEAATLMTIISRAATDPQFDIAKMERLLEMHRQIGAMRSEGAFNSAMTLAQSEMGPIATNAENLQTHSKYATYAKLDGALRPIYTKHGFALSFDEADSPKAEHVRVTCIVSHTSGHSRTYHTDMPADGKGAKGGDVMTKTHAAGAAKSYGMRYLLKGIFNVAVGEDDKDGNDPDDCVGPGQAANIKALLTEINANEESFLRTIKAKSIEEIKAAAYSTVIGILEAKRRKS